MKKRFKTIALLVLGYTIGEFITGWRCQTTPTTIREYFKEYIKTSAQGYSVGYNFGETMTYDPETAKKNLKRDAKTFAFPFLKE